MFDFGFTRFITNTWTSILWALTVVLTILGHLGYTFYHFYHVGMLIHRHPNPDITILDMDWAMIMGWALLVFVAYTLAAALFLLFMRMAFELEIVIFRIETHLRSIREHYEDK